MCAETTQPKPELPLIAFVCCRLPGQAGGNTAACDKALIRCLVSFERPREPRSHRHRVAATA